MKTRAIIAAGAAVLSALSLAACSSGTATNTSNQITVWSEENEASRIQATQAMADQFTKQTGIKVKIVGVDEDQFQQLATSDAAAGKLPDVIGALPLAAVQYVASNELVNSQATQQVVDDLGAGTFDKNALQLTQYKGKQVAVPSDAWGQLILYRKDLFAKAGLPAPDTFARIKKAAQTLNSGTMAGIVMGTAPGDAFTEQSFQYFALANGCELVNSSGKVTLDSPACVKTFKLYSDLIRNDSVRGNQTVDSTRATYLAGKSAMVVWSSFLLGELAGLEKQNLPTCPQCKADPAFLAKNSGVVTALQGPDGSSPAQFGEIVSWTITKQANASAAQKFVKFMMSKAYPQWLGISPEGKFPVRHGTASNPTQFIDAWAQLKTGTSTKAPLARFYSDTVIKALEATPSKIDRWALPQGEGALAGATLGPLPVPKALNSVINGSLSPQQAAQQAQQDVQQTQAGLK